MKRIARRRPDHQTIAAYLALALVLVTGTAYAAATIDSGDVVNNSLRSADLRNNAAVRGPDVLNNSLRSGDLGSGARATIGSPDVADGAIGGATVNESGLLASRIIARLGGAVNQPIPLAAGPVALTNNSYQQGPGAPNQFIGGGRLTFSAACTQPRNANLYLLLDDPSLAAQGNLVGAGFVSDTGAGAATRTFSFSPFPGGGPAMEAPVTTATTPRQLFVAGDLNCSAGSGATLDTTIIDVVGHR